MTMTLKTLALVGLLALGCTRIRDEATYRTEINFTSQAIASANVHQRALLAGERCTCTDNVWTPAVCADAAESLAVLTSRWNWHRQMQLHNAGLAEDPGAVPVVPAVTCEVGR